MAWAVSIQAQSSSEIFHQIKKFNSFKSALYMAAHPDDENTRVIAWLENGEKARTAYLSLTRGDGGQNLIGKELGPELGVLRTQELLAARSIDGGEQFFTRAVDFGYSKSADESFEKWNREDILHDAIWVIRKFQPDVIITRFPPDKRGGHGHHTASAMLAIEAYEKAGDPNVFPEQLKHVEVWQPKAVYWNASTWWNRKLDSIAANNEDYLVADIGGYDELLGVSYNELGTMARSQHKCQGFGVRIERGQRKEYFQWLAGEKLSGSFFEETQRGWDVIGDESLAALGEQLERDYDFNNPAASVEVLMKMYPKIMGVKKSAWVEAKQKELHDLLISLLGIHVEALAKNYAYEEGEEVEISVEILNRGDVVIEPTGISILGGISVEGGLVSEQIEKNVFFKKIYKMPAPDRIWNAYWLNSPFVQVDGYLDYKEYGMPENYPLFLALVSVKIYDQQATLFVPVEYKWSDRVKGEMKRPVVTTPSVSASFLEQSFVFNSEEQKEIAVVVKNYGNAGTHEIQLNFPKGWSAESEKQSITLEKKYEEHVLMFKVTSPKKESKGEFTVSIDNKSANSVSEIMYDHIPAQLVYLPTKATLLNLAIDIEPGKVAYIEGAGDQVDLAIEQMGYEVVHLSKEDLSTQDLSQFQAIVTGIRAYNVHPWLTDFHSVFMNYVKEGGNFIIQYNTRSSAYGTDKMGPYPFKISRDRVSEEDAKVKFVDPKHPLINEPNKMTKNDFDGWVQERGLYFANEWDNQYQTLFSWNDKGEAPKLGGLLYTPFGEGAFMYTGISFFRELPAGVPGAFKLLANMISHEAK
jgi:LmbE family N-acetylglucosaminyl deacetylase